MRKISYIRTMLLHVASPIMCEFSKTAPSEVMKGNFELMSELIGTTLTYSSNLLEHSTLPFSFKRDSRSPEFASINSARSNIRWEWILNVAKGSDLKASEKSLTKTVASQMKLAKAAEYKLGKISRRPAVNLPDGTVTLSLDATGLPI